MLQNPVAINILNEYNIRPSLQRIAVLNFLIKNPIHPTADEIYTALVSLIPTLSKTTVYNVLNNLVDNGAVKALTIDEKNVRYDADTANHAHFRCSCCGMIYDVDEPCMNHSVGGFEVEEVQVYYKGLCPQCVKSRSNVVGEEKN